MLTGDRLVAVCVLDYKTNEQMSLFCEQQQQNLSKPEIVVVGIDNQKILWL